MFDTLKKRIKNEKGLSLVELLAVIVILAIVAAIAVPSIGNIINNQRDKAILSEISGLVSASKIAFADGSCTRGTNDVVCTNASGSTNQVDFAGTKITAGTVTFKDGKTDPANVIISDLTNTGTFKGKNATAFGNLLSTTNGFTEAALNTAMGN